MARAHEMLTVQSGDVKLAVYVSGSRRAPPLILVHGYPDSAAVWAPVRAQLAKRYRVIAYDVRGAGAS
ncbi:alpha/beta fold hydrolase, partial [Burkholderia cenocepacia]